MKNLLFALLVFIFMFSRGAAAEVPESLGKNRVTIGVILPLAGDNASVGEAVRNGITLALEKIPAELKQRMKFVYEDDSLVPRNAVSAFNKLIASDKADVIVNYSSSTGNALAPLAEARKIPMIAIATDPRVVTDKRYVVSYWVSPEEEVRVILPEIKKRGYKKIARITTLHDWSLSMKRFFDRANTGVVEIGIDEEYPLDVKDFKPLISRIRAKNDVEAIFTILNIGHLGLFARQAREQGLTQPIFGFEMFENASEVKVSNGALVGQWYINGADPKGEFLKHYEDRFPEASIYAAANGHDIAILLAEAVRKSSDSEAINDFFHSVKDLPGVLGNITATGDNRFDLPAVVKVVPEL